MDPFIAKLKEKKIKILASAHSTADLAIIGGAVRAAGFEVAHQAVMSQVVSILETEAIDWVITAVGLDEEINIYSLLKICTQYSTLTKLKVTVVISELQSKKHLPYLMEWGLFSSVIAEIKSGDLVRNGLIEMVNEVSKYSESLRYAFDRSWNILYRFKLKTELLQLCSSATAVFPGDVDILLKVAKAQFLCEEREKGEQTLAQVAILDPNAMPKVTKMAHDFLSRDLKVPEKFDMGIGPFGKTSVVGVGLPAAIINQINPLLDRLGVEAEFFTKPSEFMDWIAGNSEPSIVLPGWIMEEIPGAVFIQRLRTARYLDCWVCPIGLNFDDSDMAILAEMGCFHWLCTPFTDHRFTITLVGLVQGERRSYDSRVLLQNIKNQLSKDLLMDAKSTLALLESSGRAGAGVVDLAKGEIAYYEKEYEAARAFAQKSFKVTIDPVSALNLLGKACMKLGDFETAFSCFDDAQLISPLNVSRLCKIAESQSQMGHVDDAEGTLKDAESIDAESQEVIGAKAKLSLDVGDVDVANEAMSKMGEISDVVAFLNNKAVTMSLKGEFDQSADLYEQALKAIPDNHSHYKSTINFNMGLMFLRQKNTKKAIDAFTRCSAKENEPLAKRAYDIVSTIHKAQKLNKDINISSGISEKKESKETVNMKKINRDLTKTRSTLSLKKGDRLCFTFFIIGQKNRSVEESLAKNLIFKSKGEMEVDGKTVWL